ncbi:MAG: D-alanine--D-alanine ligase [Bacteroidales bacterium]
METKLNIAILAGGNSSEANISLKSAAQIASWIDSNKYNTYTIYIKGIDWVLKHPELGEICIDKNDFTATIKGEKIHFDCALIAIHGTPGENGLLQGYLEMMNIPYTSGSVMNSSVTFNKYYCKELVKETGVHLAKGIILKRGQKFDTESIIKTLGLPIFVKPNESGSSYGVSKVKFADDLIPAIDNAFKEDKTIILEEFIAGREFSSGVFKSDGKKILMPVTEIISMNEFFDYEAKYLSKSKEVTPAEISDNLMKKMQDLSSEIYDRLDCHGIVRVDYIVDNDRVYFLEINTVPGMSEASIIPQQVKAMGGNMRDMFTLVIEDAIKRSKI